MVRCVVIDVSDKMEATSEADKLRRQIDYLSNLISNAQRKEAPPPTSRPLAVTRQYVRQHISHHDNPVYGPKTQANYTFTKAKDIPSAGKYSWTNNKLQTRSSVTSQVAGHLNSNKVLTAVNKKNDFLPQQTTCLTNNVCKTIEKAGIVSLSTNKQASTINRTGLQTPGHSENDSRNLLHSVTKPDKPSEKTEPNKKTENIELCKPLSATMVHQADLQTLKPSKNLASTFQPSTSKPDISSKNIEMTKKSDCAQLSKTLSGSIINISGRKTSVSSENLSCKLQLSTSIFDIPGDKIKASKRTEIANPPKSLQSRKVNLSSSKSEKLLQNLWPAASKIKPSSDKPDADIEREIFKFQLKVMELQKSFSLRQKPVNAHVRTSIESTNTKVNNNNTLINMLSLSPYKLKRVHSDSELGSAGGDKVLENTTCLSNPEPITCIQPKSSNQYLANLITCSPSTSLSKGLYTSILSDSNVMPAHSNKPTHSKIINHSKYSFRRQNSQSATKSNHSKSHAMTPSKFLKLSKYSLKRVRRSLSDEHKLSSSSSPTLNIHSPAQAAANMIRGKYKMFKVSSTIGNILASPSSNIEDSHYSPRFLAPTKQIVRPNNFYSASLNRRLRHTGKGNWWKQQYHKQRGSWMLYKKSYGRKSYHHQAHHIAHFWRERKELLVQKKLEHLKKTVPFHPRLKLDRRNTSEKNEMTHNCQRVQYTGSPQSCRFHHLPIRAQHRGRLETSKVKFLNTTSTKTVTVRGIKFRTNRDGTSLKKVEAVINRGTRNAGVTSLRPVSTGCMYRGTSSYTCRRAMQVMNRTLHRRALKTRRQVLKTRDYCMFFNRFGRCNRGDKCKYIHDPEKVAVCTRFLRGTCKVSDCPFSHKVAREKMPVCSYFLKGLCHREACPYLHVNVNKDAEVCSDFVKGFCPLGEKCKKKHTLECQEFKKSGTCSRGRQCPLKHRPEKFSDINKGTRQTLAKSTKAQDENPVLSNQAATFQSMSILSHTKEITLTEMTEMTSPSMIEVPFRDQKLPAYISLNLGYQPITMETSNAQKQTELDRQKGELEMKIRPQFVCSKKKQV